ncbi:MAG: dTMP kinase [Nitriliruptoraceae bacterium]
MDDRQRAGEAGAPPPRGGSVAAYRSLFRNRSFRALATATLLSSLGDWMGFLAIIALTADILGPTRAAAFAVSGVMIARVLPSLLLGPVAGVFVDRWDRRRVMIATHLGRGTVMALIPFTNEVLTLLLATLVIELMSALFGPAKDAVLPSIVARQDLVAANQVNLLTTYGTLPVSAMVYSLLLAGTVAMAPEGSFLAGRPLAVPIWVNALTFFIAAPLLLLVRLPGSARGSVTLGDGIEEAPAPRTPVAPPMGAWAALLEGFRFVATQPVIRALIFGVMAAFAVAGVVITTGEFFARLLNAGPSGYGILVSAVGIGLVFGLVLTGPLERRIPTERLFAPGIWVAGGALIVTALMPTLLAATAPALVMGLGAGVAFICGYTILQRRVDDTIRGRTFGAFNSGVRVAIFGSSVAVPLLIGVLGREQRVVVINDSGQPVSLYPYTFGGVRITLLVGGVLAVVGAILVGRVLARALQDESGLDLGAGVEVELAALRGTFVVFEGGDGSGKSTQIRLLRAAVERAGHVAVLTREPGGTRLGEAIRDLVLTPAAEQMDDRTEALLYAAARAQHVREVIVPALQRGQVVLCDRFTDSSVVYQGAGRGLGEERVAELNRWATAGVTPDLVVLLDVDPATGLERATRGGDPDRLEAAGLGFHRLVRAAYRRRAAADPARYLVLDAARPVEELHAAIRRRVELLLAPSAGPVATARGRHQAGSTIEAGALRDGTASGSGEDPGEGPS